MTLIIISCGNYFKVQLIFVFKINNKSLIFKNIFLRIKKIINTFQFSKIINNYVFLDKRQQNPLFYADHNLMFNKLHDEAITSQNNGPPSSWYFDTALYIDMGPVSFPYKKK